MSFSNDSTIHGYVSGTDTSIHGNNSSLHSNSSPNSSSTERKNADFSISAILSDDTGSSKRAKVTPVREQRRASSGLVLSPPGGHRVLMSTPSRYNSHLLPSSPPSLYPPMTATPNSRHIGILNQSFGTSPINISLLLSAFASSPTPSEVTGGESRLGLETGKGGGGGFPCNDSLGMLSTVALYHSELSDSGEGEGKKVEEEGGRKKRVTSVGDGMARMKLESSSDTADTTLSTEDRCSTPPPPHSSPLSTSAVTRARGKGTTPFILKRDRKRRRQLTGSFASHTSSIEDKTSANPHRPLILSPSSTSHPPPPPNEHPNPPLNTGFLSPTPTKQSPHHTSFSPSIFLSRPQNSVSSSDKSADMDTSLPRVGNSTSSVHAAMTGDGRREAEVVWESDEVREDAPADSSSVTLKKEECKRRRDDPAVVTASVTMDVETPTVQVSSFTTSTPIKQNKENTGAAGLHLSPTFLSPSECSEMKRPCLRDTAYETSSGSDSEAPVKVHRSRSHLLHRRSKARAQLSPLLENACSPIAKTDHRPQSSLLTANFPTPATSGVLLPGVREPQMKLVAQDPQNYSPRYPLLPTPTTQQAPNSMPYPPPLPPHLQVPPPIHIPFTCGPVPTQFPMQPARPNLCMSMMPVTPHPFFPMSMSMSPLSPPHASYLAPPHSHLMPQAVSPTTTGFLHPGSFYYYPNTPQAYGYPTTATAGGGGAAVAAAAAMGNVSQKWGGSPLSAQWEKTGQIQSVPPWFIFEQNRPEGKRLRLTEAINRSLSETPSQNPKLPAEWTKYACGQTDDQRMLTQKARSFLQSGRRQLTFENINP